MRKLLFGGVASKTGGQGGRNKGRKNQAPAGAMFESLEGRCMLSAAPAGPTNLVATPSSPNTINLSWRDNSSNETAFKIYSITGSGTTWQAMGTAKANATFFKVDKLSPETRYYYRVRAINDVGGSAFSNDAKATTPTTSRPTNPARPVSYGGPITITKGGTYTGNWQSLNSNVPAVQIKTSQPVVILNSNIRSSGTLIDSRGYSANVTVKNTRGYALNPNVRGRYAGRFLNVEGFVNVDVENSYMSGTSGIYVYGYQGNHTVGQSVHILRNQALNIDGRFSNGNGGYLTGADDNYYVQFFQTNALHGMVGAEVAWNQVVNQPGKSRVEDNISIYDTTGTPSSPFLIHDNYIQGAYPADPWHDTTFTGGGIMLSDQGSAWVRAYNNQVVSTANYGMAISSGHDNQFYNNRIVSWGRLPDGSAIASQNVGAYIWDQNGEGNAFANNSGQDNLIGWNVPGDRNDSWTPNASSWARNTSWPGTISAATEAGEWTFWQSKLAKAGIFTGVKAV